MGWNQQATALVSLCGLCLWSRGDLIDPPRPIAAVSKARSGYLVQQAEDVVLVDHLRNVVNLRPWGRLVVAVAELQERDLIHRLDLRDVPLPGEAQEAGEVRARQDQQERQDPSEPECSPFTTWI